MNNYLSTWKSLRYTSETMTLESLSAKTVAELRTIANEHNVALSSKMKKAEIIDKILETKSDPAFNCINLSKPKIFRINRAIKRRLVRAIEIKVNNKMPRVIIVKKYDTAKNSWELSAIPQSALVRYLFATGGSAEDIIIVNGAIGKYRRESNFNEIQARHEDTVNNGINLNGVHYEVAFATASEVKDAEYVMLSERVYVRAMWYVMNGYSMRGWVVAPNKAHVQRGLTMSASHTFRETFGCSIPIDRVVVVPDRYIEIEKTVDFVNGTEVKLQVPRRMKVNVCDGLVLILPWLCDNEFFSIRASSAFVKGGALPINFRAFAKQRGIAEIVDRWGNKHDINNVDMILFESAFKCAKQIDTWEHWCQNWKRYSHHFCVCVREHAATPKPSSYQIMQTLTGGPRYANVFAERAAESLNSYRNVEQAVYLTPRAAAPVFKAYPALFNTYYGQHIAQENYESKRTKALGCRLPGLTRSSFVAPDPVAALEAAFGLLINGVLHAGECSCVAANYGKIDIMRYPHLGHEHIIMNNMRATNQFFQNGPTMYLNVKDDTIVRLRGDYDGDHATWSQDEYLIALAEQSTALYHNITVDWDAPEGKKVKINEYELKKFLINNVSESQIGLIANDQTRAFNHLNETLGSGKLSREDFRRAMAEGQMMGNIKIDAAKHGDMNLDASSIYIDAISDGTDVTVINTVTKAPVSTRYFERHADAVKYAKEKKDSLAGARGYYVSVRPRKFLLPDVIRYAKANKEHPVTDMKYWGERVHDSNSFVDKISKRIAELVPEKLEIEGLADLQFDATVLQLEPHRPTGRMAGLWSVGRRNDKTNTFENRGFFNEIAGRNSETWKSLDLSGTLSRNWDEECGRIAREEVRLWAEAHGGTLEEAYDTIAIRLFGMGKAYSEGDYGKMVFRLFWNAFSDLALKAIEQNLMESNAKTLMGQALFFDCDPCADVDEIEEDLDC